MKIRIEHEVPDGDLCWNHKPPHQICQHFDNSGGSSFCSLFDLTLKDMGVDIGVRKAKHCKAHEVKDVRT